MNISYYFTYIQIVFATSSIYISFEDGIKEYNDQDQIIQYSNFFNTSENIFDLENFDSKIFTIIKNLIKTNSFSIEIEPKDIWPVLKLKDQLNFNNPQALEDFNLNLTLSIIDSNIKVNEFVQPIEYDYIYNWAPGLKDIIFKKRDNKFYLLKVGEDDILPFFKHESSQNMLVLTKDICKLLVDLDEKTLKLFMKFINYNKIQELVILDYKLTQGLVKILSRLKSINYLVYETCEKGHLPANINILEQIEGLSLFIDSANFPLMKSINSLINLKSLKLSAENQTHSFVSQLTNLINLTELELSNFWIAPADIETISTFTNLNSLIISGYTHANISKALVNLKNLINLKIVIGNISNTFLPDDQRIFNFPDKLDNLKKLYIDVTEIRKGFGSKLSKGLKIIRILNAKIDDDDLQEIFNIESLFFLDVRNKNEGINDWRDITKLVNLRSLNVSGLSLKPSNLISFSKLKNLKRLNISNLEDNYKELYSGEKNLGCFEGVLNCLENFKNLRFLDVSGNSWVKYNLKHFSRLKNLKDICLKNCSITSFDLDLPLIIHLDLSDNTLTADSIDKISNLSRLTKLNLSSSIREGVSINPLIKLSNLKSLSLNNNILTNEQLEAVIFIAKILFSLELKKCGVKNITHLKSWKLRRLKITSTSLSSLDVAALSRLQNLQEINLDNTFLGKAKLNFLTNLMKVSMRGAFANPRNEYIIERMRIKETGFSKIK